MKVTQLAAISNTLFMADDEGKLWQRQLVGGGYQWSEVPLPEVEKPKVKPAKGEDKPDDADKNAKGKSESNKGKGGDSAKS